MDDNSRLESLESRLSALETELQRLKTVVSFSFTSARGAGPPARSEADPAVPVLSPEPGPAVPSGPSQAEHPDAERRRPARRLSAWAALRRSGDLETWFGENALLVVGLLALIFASGFLLKYAFDQGWVSPGLRVLAGLLGGLAVASYGERLHRSGMRRYGGGLVGAGAAITYLALWGAAGPYQLIPPELGILALALVAGLVIASAVSAGTEYLAALACGGALLAPIVLGDAESASPNVLVAYTGIVAVGTAAVAVPRSWRTTLALALIGFFLIPTAMARSASPLFLIPYIVAGGAASLLVARSRGWDGLYATAFVLAWFAIAVTASGADGAVAWLLAFALPVVVAPSFLGYVRAAESRPPGPTAEEALEDPLTRYFGLSAFAWAGVTLLARPGGPDAYYALLLLVAISLPYVALGVRRQMTIPHAIGLAIAAWGVYAQWDGLGIPIGWGVLALLSATATRSGSLTKNRWVGAALAGLAAYQLLSVALAQRDLTESAFLGGSSFTLYFVVAVFAVLGGPLWGEPAAKGELDSAVKLRAALWIAAGLVFLVGGTQEILFHFDRPGAGVASLVGNLAVSGFWLVYAGALLTFGFLRDIREVRVAGLVMTGLAIIKVALYDLTQLEALYRVASFFLLALIALVAAYAYHRRGKGKHSAINTETPP